MRLWKWWHSLTEEARSVIVLSVLAVASLSGLWLLSRVLDDGVFGSVGVDGIWDMN